MVGGWGVTPWRMGSLPNEERPSVVISAPRLSSVSPRLSRPLAVEGRTSLAIFSPSRRGEGWRTFGSV
jgi:hypothetical protein